MAEHEPDEVEELFHRLATLAARARAAALVELARSSPALAENLASLLRAHDTSGAVDRLQERLADGVHRAGREPGELTGRQVRQYAIGEMVARGGMGDVYRAHDARLNRDMALKFLPEWLGRDPAAKERFLTEARIISALDHTNICSLLEANETDDGQLFLVMPFYEGETLRTRLARGPLLASEATDIGLQLARGLSAAHEQGIIHRDIKPANLLITQSGRVKILDFGVAKLADRDITAPGQTPGTVRYMAPEQAAGNAVDARADLWSAGLVLREMLTGHAPEPGEELADSLAGLDDALAGIIERLLQPSPENRTPDARSLAAELAGTLPGRAGARRRRRQRPRRDQVRAEALGVALVVAILLGAGALLIRTGPGTVSLGRATRLHWQEGFVIQPAVAPDGEFIAYTAGSATYTRISVRRLADGRATPLTDDSTPSQSAPSWSPDGSRVLFLADGSAFSVPARGGAMRLEVPSRGDSEISSAEWAPDGRRLAFVAADSLFVQEEGGAPRFVATVESANSCRWSPDGASIACAVGNKWYAVVGPLFGNQAVSAIVLTSVADGTQRYLTDRTALNQAPAWSADGRSIYFVSNRHGPLDIYVAEVGGDAQPARLTAGLGAHWFSMAGDGGRLVYSVLRDHGNIWSLPLGALPLAQDDAIRVTQGAASIEGFTVSEDGQWILYSADVAGNGDIYRVPVSGGTAERLTTDPAGDYSPDFAPGGNEFAFQSWRRGSRDIFVQSLTGGDPQLVVHSPREEVMPRWSRDGSAIVYGYFDDVGGAAIVRRDSSGRWSPPVRRLERSYWADWSPDGRFLAFADQLFGGSLMLVPVDSGPVHPVLPPGAPGWRSAVISHVGEDGREIYFLSRDEHETASIWKVPADGGVPVLVVEFNDPERPVFRPYWVLQSERIFFIAQEQQSELWTMDVVRRP